MTPPKAGDRIVITATREELEAVNADPDISGKEAILVDIDWAEEGWCTLQIQGDEDVDIIKVAMVRRIGFGHRPEGE